MLQTGYRKADYSVVYPTARGTGPALTALVAVCVFGEELSALGVIGICAVLAGIVFLAMPNKDKTIKGGLGSGVFLGLLTGFFIASYSSLDGFAIQLLGMAPLIYCVPGMFVRLLFLGPPVLLRPSARAAFKEDLQKRWKYALFIGAAHPAAYLLVLFALLAYVAPTREISMLLALFIGAAALKEKVTSHKIFGVVCMLAGVILLALAK